LSSCIVARYRTYRARCKADYKAELAKLVTDAIAARRRA
jgi:phenylpyruvate tautomerase PptA (4-oxalocrotonate tautomerase family)